MIAYRATLDVPRELVQFTAKLLAAERRRRGTPAGSRALTCFWEAMLALRWFRDRTSPGALARDHGISLATAYRYLDEVIEVLAAQAPDLRQALERAKAEGLSHVILDGKIIPADRCKEPAISVKGQVIDLWYSGKAHRHGGNIQAVLAPGGFPLWASDAEPGSVHDLTAARIHALPALYHAAATGLPALADTGYDGAGIGIHTPVKQPSGLRLPAGEHRVGKASTWTDRVGRDRTPSIPGQELAGVVTAFGYGTTRLSVGQRVFGLTDSYRGGGLAEYAAIEARNLAPLPGDVDFTVGASLPMPGVEPLRLSPCSGQ